MIDSHHHLWKYSEAQYPWIPSGSPLAQDQLIPELTAVTAGAGVDGTVVVQARQTLQESVWLLGLAGETEIIQGVVGWVPLIDECVEKEIRRLAENPNLKGVRHVLQEEADEYFLRDDFHRGLALLPPHGLRYDLLIYQRQLPVAIQLVDRQPQLSFVLDHLAKPAARNGRVEEDWRTGMIELAKREHVLGVKFSGLVTEFPQGEIDPETLKAYFDETLQIFGADRLMFGSDWPVCLLQTSYKDWAETVADFTAALSASERHAILHGNAVRIYDLQ